VETVLYHGGCNDGFCAAWLMHKVFPNAKFLAVSYGAPPPVVHGDVYVVDFHFSYDEMMLMLQTCNTIMTIDHHKTTEVLLNMKHDRLGLMYRENRSGAQLTFDYLAARYLMRDHWLIRYTADRDLWRHALPHTHEITAAISSYPHIFEVWDSFDFDKMVADGAAILRYKNQLVQRIVDHAAETEIAGHRVLEVNTPIFQSEVCEILGQGRAFGVAYYTNRDHQVCYSLRSKTTDVRAIAEQFGGGGHTQAAGFVVNP